ncbi:MAG TPA: hypothetical protein VN175_02005 [Rhizomicrobium sp.]|nr:hypothetical protein [Rhizomicrobium sp.]
MRRPVVLVLLALGVAALAVPALAQNAATPPASPTENVTVTGIKDVDKAVTDFVGAMTVPTRVAGKMARWGEGICPITAGVRPTAVTFITQHVKDIATQVGAPVNDRAGCKPNIEIVFTTTPQALLDTIFIKYPELLGYHDNSAQATQLATVTYPIQSWYSTATRDLRGQPEVDGLKTGGVTMTMQLPEGGYGGPKGGALPMLEMNMPGARVTNVTGGRLGDGTRSEFHHVVVVVEPAKLLEYELGTLSDYIALLALAQLQPPKSCQELPTIMNLLVAGCSTPPRALTNVDFAYLRALYKVTATTTFHGQRGEMIYQMDKSLGAPQ